MQIRLWKQRAISSNRILKHSNWSKGLDCKQIEGPHQVLTWNEIENKATNS